MDIHIATYRSRIGSFRTSGNFSYISERKQTYKSRNSSTRTFYNFRRIAVFIALVISIVSRLENVMQIEQQVQSSYGGPIAIATDPVSFFILGGQDSAPPFPNLHLSFHDVLAVHSAATLQGVQAGHLDRGWIVAAIPLQYSILSDSNFYARYTYGNRTNGGIKLTHWNAGNAYLENKTNDIENLILDHHPHLLGISEANLHKDHSIDNCKIEDYDLITCRTIDNENLRIRS